MPVHPLLEQQTANVSPHAIAIVEGPLVGDPLHLDQLEEQAVANAVEPRRLAFATGRTYAKQALLQLGKEPSAIPKNNDRSPSWPPGMVGSIAHSGAWAIAAVAHQEHISGLGVDVETISRVTPSIGKRITTEAEQQWAEDPQLRAVIFSVKEAVYKAQHPLLGLPLGFRDVTLTLDLQQRSAHTLVEGLTLNATWHLSKDQVTSLVIASAPQL